MFTVLRYRVEHPELRSKELAEQLTTMLGKDVSEANARVLVHRAREKFTNLLIEGIMPSLNERTLDSLEEELIDLNLFTYCRDVLEKLRKAGGSV